MEKFKSGFVVLVGRANVGKSTFINKIIGQKVSITSKKAQTTRHKFNCIFNDKNVQIIFVDCPGFLKPKNILTKKLNKLILSALSDVDIIIDMVDMDGGIGSGDHFVFEIIKKYNKPKILLLNKTDLVSKEKIANELAKLKEIDFFEEIIPVSAQSGYNLDKTLKIITRYLPEGPMYYPDDIVTDIPLRKIIADIVREKLMESLLDEIPHSITTEVESFEETKTKEGKQLVKIECVIIAEKESHKAIIIGKKGSFLKKIGQSARLEIEELLDQKVFLNLWVKINKNWTKDESALKILGYE